MQNSLWQERWVMALLVSKIAQLVWGGELEDLVLRQACSRKQQFDHATNQALALGEVVDQTSC
jgi:hypothetical protein